MTALRMRDPPGSPAARGRRRRRLNISGESSGLQTWRKVRMEPRSLGLYRARPSAAFGKRSARRLTC